MSPPRQNKITPAPRGAPPSRPAPGPGLDELAATLAELTDTVMAAHADQAQRLQQLATEARTHADRLRLLEQQLSTLAQSG